MASILRAYNLLLLRRPILASSGTAAVLFGAGDIIAQQAVERKGSQYDFMRTARLTFYGGALFGPSITKWYSFLSKLKFTSPTRALLSRVALDQFVLTPVLVPFFFGAMSLLEGKPEVARERIENAFFPTLVRNWAVFIPAQLLNFTYVPGHLRLVSISVVGLFWNTYLSVANQKEQRREFLRGMAIEKGAMLGESL